MNLQERIAQFRKMSSEDPENELGHFRLGQLLMDDNQPAEAAKSFERTLELSPEFSKVFQLLGECLLKTEQKEKAIEVLTRGWAVAEERGDKMPRDAMGKLLTELGAPIPKPAAPVEIDDGTPGTGFRCERPGCMAGKRAKSIDKRPIPEALGLRIQEKICQDCWEAWFKDQSVKVINELHLDLSTEPGTAEYEKYMLEFFGFDTP